ncbi:hypothetical protein ACRS5S_05005 [Nocardia asiatica]|uniref:hypothetical protein n=1 Tax=Nocardia asiatica TaxID=209252 RepID=UPI0024586215|nr:hypothetical protein [Nocardia asiatica]
MRAHLRGAIAAASRMKARDLEIYRVLHAMDRLDPASAAEAVRAMAEDRRGGVAHWRIGSPRPTNCARTSR